MWTPGGVASAFAQEWPTSSVKVWAPATVRAGRAERQPVTTVSRPDPVSVGCRLDQVVANSRPSRATSRRGGLRRRHEEARGMQRDDPALTPLVGAAPSSSTATPRTRRTTSSRSCVPAYPRQAGEDPPARSRTAKKITTTHHTPTPPNGENLSTRSSDPAWAHGSGQRRVDQAHHRLNRAAPREARRRAPMTSRPPRNPTARRSASPPRSPLPRGLADQACPARLNGPLPEFQLLLAPPGPPSPGGTGGRSVAGPRSCPGESVPRRSSVARSAPQVVPSFRTHPLDADRGQAVDDFPLVVHVGRDP